jgi:hypothetical protein
VCGCVGAGVASWCQPHAQHTANPSGMYGQDGSSNSTFTQIQVQHAAECIAAAAAAAAVVPQGPKESLEYRIAFKQNGETPPPKATLGSFTGCSWLRPEPCDSNSSSNSEQAVTALQLSQMQQHTPLRVCTVPSTCRPAGSHTVTDL